MEIHGSRDGYGGRDGVVLLTPLFRDVFRDGRSAAAVPVPMLYCSCAMAAHRFAGATEPEEPIVRIAIADLRRFVEAVRLLERDRRGEATLLCPQLRLSLSITDRAGHAHLAAALTDYQTDGDHQVAIGFMVDPTTLPGILQDLEELLAFPDSSRAAAAALEP